MKAAALLLALPVLLAGCLAGQPDAADRPLKGQIDGAVLDHLLNPFGNQTVHLVQLDRVDRTSELGGFTFRGVPAGVYTVTTSLPTGQAATQVVEVRAGEVARVILQVMPQPGELTYWEAYSYRSPGERPEAQSECRTCEWAVPLGPERPEEVTFTAIWEPSILGPDNGLFDEHNHLDITITDGRGFQLYNGRDRASGVSVAIDGADLHPEATELRVTVRFGGEFLSTSQDFSMDSMLTFYHGATRLEMFSVPE